MTLPPENIRLHGLVVEHSSELRLILEAALLELGFQVSAAADAEEGLAWLMLKGTFDVLLIDASVPGSGDGIALANRARQLNPSTRIVVMTGLDAIDVTQLPDDIVVLRKPFRLAELYRHLPVPYSTRLH